ncbi:potassium transporter TrkG [Bordetella tumulicola]
MKRLLATFYVAGLTMVVFSLTMLLPLLVAYLGDDEGLTAFLEGFLLAFGGGGAVWLATRRGRSELHARDGFLLVSVVWLSLPLLAAIPLLIYFDGVGVPLSFTDAYFEAMSGLTTTGATVLTGLDYLPASINLWRSTLVWIGGLGILVLAVAILPLLGVGGHQVVRAETPGPMKDERLTPRIASTAKALYAVYFGLSVLCLVAYRGVGLSWFDAWCHTATTMGLGGFSTRDAGFAYFDSVPVEIVSMIFMTLAGISFATHFNALRQGSLRAYRICPQTIPYLTIMLGAGLAISAFLYVRGVYDDPVQALRYGMFNTISVATTTGFANVDYAAWPLVAPLTMLLLSGFVTSAGSTGGGIKMVRALLLVKQVRNELVVMLHPSAVSPIRMAGRLVSQRVMASVLAFMVVYVLSIGLLASLMLVSGLEPIAAFSAVLASINNTGPGLGSVGPMGNFGVLTDFQTWVCTFAMLIGRLELLTVMVLFTPMFWRK